MICPEARVKLQEMFTWWREHVETHRSLGCSMARAALTLQSGVVRLLGGQGVNV